MESPGEYLKREREIRGVSLEDISDATKIRVGLLVSIERNDFNALPVAAFVKGFIQAYCRYLGLDAQDAILRYEAYIRNLAESEASVLKQRVVDKIRKPKASVPYPPLSIIVIAVIAIIMIAGGIYTITSERRTSPALDPFPNKGSHEHAYSQIHTPPEKYPETKAGTKKEGPLLSVKQEGKADITSKPFVPKTSAGPLTLIIEATKHVWVKTAIDGQNPFEVSLKEGEKIKWNAKEGFSVIIGNAGGVNVIFNGEHLDSLGEEGEVVKLVLPKENQ